MHSKNKAMQLTLNRIISLYLISFTQVTLVLCCDSNDSCDVQQAKGQNNRKERALLFPPSSTIGILAAIAVPLDDRKNVFLSYNFEANYNSPYQGSDYIPGPLDRLQLTRSFGSDEGTKSNLAQNRTLGESIETATAATEANQSHHDNAKRSLVTRKNIYKSIERKLNAAGYNGHECLLRAVCEAAEIPLGLHNGVLGDIMHIIFTPSSSANENIISDFYDAEIRGTMNKCKRYSKNCPESIFDWISFLEEHL